MIQPIDAYEGENPILPCKTINRGDAFLHWYKNDERIDMSNNS